MAIPAATQARAGCAVPSREVRELFSGRPGFEGFPCEGEGGFNWWGRPTLVLLLGANLGALLTAAVGSYDVYRLLLICVFH